MNLPSRLLNEAVNQFARLPGVGNRTALRLVLFLLKQKPEIIRQFSESVARLASDIQYCRECHAVADSQVCSICSDAKRDHGTLCVVQDIRDVIAIENTHQYRGVYHVLGGVIAPFEGVGPEHLNISTLVNKIRTGKIREVILALSGTMEGETTALFVYKALAREPSGGSVVLTSISRGIGVGEPLEYTDEITLGRSIINRVPFETSLPAGQSGVPASPKTGTLYEQQRNS